MRKLLQRFSICLAILPVLNFAGCSPVAFAQASPFNLNIFKTQSFTATGQTGAVIQLNGLTPGSSTVGSSYASGTITVGGTAITTVSFQVMGSSDNGATFYVLPVFSVASPTSPPVSTVTATAAGLYQFSLAGLSHVKFVTTGTFTATSVTLILTASPNASISRNGSGGGGSSTTLENTYSAPGAFSFAHNLNSEFPQVTCYTRVGASFGSATWTATPVDANDTSVSVPSAGDYICSFSSGGTLASSFSVATSPTTLLFEPTMTGTQSPTFTVNQTGIGGFTGTANYTSSGLASGMTGAFSPLSITGTGSNTLTVSFPFSQTPAATSFTVQGAAGSNTHAASPSITVGNINQGLVECWPMTDGSGTTFADGCGTANTQTLSTGTLTWGTNAGLPGSTPLFSATAFTVGANDTATNFDGTSPFSVSTWVNIPSLGSTEHTLVGTLNATSGNFAGWELGIAPASSSQFLQFLLINNFPTNALSVRPTTALSSGTLYYVVVTYDGSRTPAGVTFYINGVLSANFVDINGLTASAANPQNAIIGARSDGSDPLNGVMAYTRIYNRVLSQTDVTNYFNAGAR